MYNKITLSKYEESLDLGLSAFYKVAVYLYEDSFLQ